MASFPVDIYFQNSSTLLSEEAMLAKRQLDVMAVMVVHSNVNIVHLGLRW